MLPTHNQKTFDDIGTPVLFLTGPAGTGKSYLITKALENDPTFGLPLATTGIAAINIGTQTVHSALGFSDTESIRAAYNDGILQKKLKAHKAKGYQWLIIDEVSMLSYQVLNYILLALEEVNANESYRSPLGLLLVGDFLQLPPVPDDKIINGQPVYNKYGAVEKWPTPWTFKADEWQRFAESTQKLTKVYRQDDPKFLNALNALRKGNGGAGALMLKQAGASFVSTLSQDYDGPIIVGTNKEAGMINSQRLNRLEGDVFTVTSERWCTRRRDPAEWKYVEEVQPLKIGALVMILANEKQTFTYANGDLGHVEGFICLEEVGKVDYINVRLIRNDQVVAIPKIKRHLTQSAEPLDEHIFGHKDKIYRGIVPGSHRQVWVTGELDYFPIRLAYGTTVHRCQGLTLDKAAVDIRSNFFYHPAMVYVAISRVRSANNLTIVGSIAELAKKTRMDAAVERFI